MASDFVLRQQSRNLLRKLKIQRANYEAFNYSQNNSTQANFNNKSRSAIGETLFDDIADETSGVGVATLRDSQRRGLVDIDRFGESGTKSNIMMSGELSDLLLDSDRRSKPQKQSCNLLKRETSLDKRDSGYISTNGTGVIDRVKSHWGSGENSMRECDNLTEVLKKDISTQDIADSEFVDPSIIAKGSYDEPVVQLSDDSMDVRSLPETPKEYRVGFETPKTVRRRRLIDKNIHVDSELSMNDELYKSDRHKLNFSYSNVDSILDASVGNMKSATRRAEERVEDLPVDVSDRQVVRKGVVIDRGSGGQTLKKIEGSENDLGTVSSGLRGYSREYLVDTTQSSNSGQPEVAKPSALNAQEDAIQKMDTSSRDDGRVTVNESGERHVAIDKDSMPRKSLEWKKPLYSVSESQVYQKDKIKDHNSNQNLMYSPGVDLNKGVGDSKGGAQDFIFRAKEKNELNHRGKENELSRSLNKGHNDKRVVKNRIDRVLDNHNVSNSDLVEKPGSRNVKFDSGDVNGISRLVKNVSEKVKADMGESGKVTSEMGKTALINSDMMNLEKVTSEKKKSGKVISEIDKYDISKSELVNSHKMMPEKLKSEKIKSGIMKSEKVKSEKVKSEKVKPRNVKPENVKPEKVKPEKVKPEKMKSDKMKSDKMKNYPYSNVINQGSCDIDVAMSGEHKKGGVESVDGGRRVNFDGNKRNVRSLRSNEENAQVVDLTTEMYEEEKLTAAVIEEIKRRQRHRSAESGNVDRLDAMKDINKSRGKAAKIPKKKTDGKSQDKAPAVNKDMMGYDWIAGLLDNEHADVDVSEALFEELRAFRKVHDRECVDHDFKETAVAVEDQKEAVVSEILKDKKVHPYRVNDRLFTEPIVVDDDEVIVDDILPTQDEPRFVRVSVPRAMIASPHKIKPHRRRSFDATDAVSLRDHCMLGWQNSRPAAVPTAATVSLKDAVSGYKTKMTTTLGEAEKVARSFYRKVPDADEYVSAPARRMEFDSILSLKNTELLEACQQRRAYDSRLKTGIHRNSTKGVNATSEKNSLSQLEKTRSVAADNTQNITMEKSRDFFHAGLSTIDKSESCDITRRYKVPETNEAKTTGDTKLLTFDDANSDIVAAQSRHELLNQSKISGDQSRSITDSLLTSTYSIIYELQRLRKEREASVQVS